MRSRGWRRCRRRGVNDAKKVLANAATTLLHGPGEPQGSRGGRADDVREGGAGRGFADARRSARA